MMTTITEVHEQEQRSHHGYLLTNATTAAAANCSKRLKTTHVACFPKEKKDGIGERVAALQQLVSPFGKTDTASVLQEATEYIRFLHDQLQVLSTPYLRTTSNGELQDGEYYNLWNRGLCLVPVASAHKIARSNGADLWAPSKTQLQALPPCTIMGRSTRI